MTKRMLIDATHAEETRVVVLDGTRLEDFDVETSTKRQLKGNIYLAKVVRVEPSLQAAFVEYGGNRHGFLAFSEIHPDYYQIPVADRQRLIEMQVEEARREEEEDDLELALHQSGDDRHARPQPAREPQPAPAADPAEAWAHPDLPPLLAPSDPAAFSSDPPGAEPNGAMPSQPLAIETEQVAYEESDDSDSYDPNGDGIDALPPPETIGGGDHEINDDQRERRMPPRFLRNYKIQEVIRRRQILLIQVVKEERGTKGAALTTYLSLAGRFGVLMPNSPRGGGISRKITSVADRRRLKEVMAELDIPRGMGMIVRTAGANRPKPEIKRDCEYLLRLWDDIREHTMKSVAPALIYEEASLIKRAIRDVYSRDIDEILVDGEEGWRAAHDFMRMLMPSHAKKVQLWRDNGGLGGQPLFARHQVEAQLDGMLMPTVQLRSGGYLVINQAEALVAIDVNSGRSTRERNIEETALRTNLEAADEVARQLRLRDLAGLIVIDFIDMESKRHNAMVERRIKEALKNDRARIQVGHISHFGLLEMSRQRLRPSLAETSFILCPHCAGTGHVRSTENAAIHVLRGIEDEGSKRRSAEIIVHVSTPVALYLLNHKRERLQEIETRYAMRVIIAADDAQIAPQFRVERVRTRSPDEFPAVVTAERSLPAPSVPDDEEEEAEPVGMDEEADETEAGTESTGDEDTPEQKAADLAGGGTPEDVERRRKRRRRRRRGARRDDALPGAPVQAQLGDPPIGEAAAAPFDEVPMGQTGADPGMAREPVTAEAAPDDQERAEAPAGAPAEAGETPPASDDDTPNRRRGRRGGRRRRRDADGEMSPFGVPGADQPDLLPVYAGPTPADPFGGRAFDIFDVMDQAERAAEAKRAPVAIEIVNEAPPEPEASYRQPDPVQDDAPPAASSHAEAQPPAVGEPEPPAADIVNTAAPEPVAEAVPLAEREAPVPANDTHPEAVAPEAAAPEEAAPEAAAPEEAAPEEAVPEAVEQEAAAPEPLVKPILVGAGGEPPAEPRRGWWRR